MDISAKPEPMAVPAVSSAARFEADRARSESLIAADIMIEGKIEGAGSVRIAGKFKGDVNVQGDLTIESGAKLIGGVRADKVVIAGELEGNIDSASLVNLLPTAVVIGDVKAGSLTVAAGARMRGQADFGWEESKSAAKAPKGFSNGVEIGSHA
jgi:cytoskeletal protein CcmA (bactofilin family)